jgi:uncharacterized Fe-S cluster protein YjdI
MKTVIGVLAATALLAVAGPATARKIDCGTIDGPAARLPVQIVSGQVTCRTARQAMSRFLPKRGRAVQVFRLARRDWVCADAHGRELMRGIVAHCAAGTVKVIALDPGDD